MSGILVSSLAFLLQRKDTLRTRLFKYIPLRISLRFRNNQLFLKNRFEYCCLLWHDLDNPQIFNYGTKILAELLRIHVHKKQIYRNIFQNIRTRNVANTTKSSCQHLSKYSNQKCSEHNKKLLSSRQSLLLLSLKQLFVDNV